MISLSRNSINYPLQHKFYGLEREFQNQLNYMFGGKKKLVFYNIPFSVILSSFTTTFFSKLAIELTY